MNVFEDLVVELKEENLLENTVIEGLPLNANFGFAEPSLGRESDFLRREAESSAQNEEMEGERRGKNSSKPRANVQVPGASVERSRLQKHFSESSSVFQMVGHVLTAVERQFNGTAQPPFDDLRVSKALHRLTQLSADALSVEFAEAEQAVENEIWAWQLALSQRDHVISVSQLRKYCESCQPALSSQALFSLARFYYEGPATDAAREKFDFVLTKLFTRPGQGGERQLICTKSEIVGHLMSRFTNWMRNSEAGPDDADNLVNSLSCDDFIAEVENAENLDELVASDFFGRVRAFKESMGDNFFSPSVAAAVIDCNVRVGNRFVQFLQTESKSLTAEQMKERYGHLDRDSFESTANRTFDLEEVIRSAEGKREARKRKAAPAPSAIDSALIEHRVEPEVVKAADEVPARFSFSSLAVNKWLLVFGTIAIVASIGLYIWAERMAGDMPVSSDVKIVDLENSSFKEFVKDARISSETFYGVTTMAWEQLSRQEKEDLLAKIIKSGIDRGYKKVSLINGTGKTVGFATANRVQVNEQ